MMKLKTTAFFCLAILMAFGYFACQDNPTSPDLVKDKTSSFRTTMAQASSSGWGYSDEDGPDKWCSLSADFGLCCEGRDGATQSPIDIVSADAEVSKLAKFRFKYKKTDLEVEHNGHTIEAHPEEGKGTIWVGDKQYNLVQFHWHTHSEHTVDGQDFPMEAHMVHQAEDGSIFVVGVLIEEGDELNSWNRIWNDLPEEEGEVVEVHRFNLRSVLPVGDHWRRKNYRYDGSFTTPPCTEGVNWLVFYNKRQLSDEQIEAFTDLFTGDHFPDGNRRPTQDLGDRTVHADQWTNR